MSKYQIYQRQKRVPRRRSIHPVWQGIGCVMLILMPLLAWGIEEILFQIALQQRWPIPYEWSLPPRWPQWMWQLPFLTPFLASTQSWTHFTARLLAWVAVLVILWLVLLFVYAAIYKASAPKDPVQEMLPPPPKVKRYRR
jgi:hypothetical protein